MTVVLWGSGFVQWVAFDILDGTLEYLPALLVRDRVGPEAACWKE